MSEMLSGRVRAIVTGLILLAIAVFLAFCNDNQASTAQSPVERGKFLATIGGCADCHSPKVFTERGPEEDVSRHLAGHPAEAGTQKLPAELPTPEGWVAMTNAHMTAWAGPWGISFAPNLTPDKKTGLGNWTAEEFMNAMRNGKHQGYGRPILPPMPWAAVGKLSDEDLLALFAYLQSLPPVDNKAPDWIIGPPPKSYKYDFIGVTTTDSTINPAVTRDDEAGWAANLAARPVFVGMDGSAVIPVARYKLLILLCHNKHGIFSRNMPKSALRNEPVLHYSG